MIPNMNTLAGLPVELLLSITDFLSLDDWICISLCSRRLFAIFKRRYNSAQYNSARPLGKMKLPVLRRLNRDLPKYFICHVCFILHKYNGSECFGLSGPLIRAKCPLRCISSWMDNHDGLELRNELIFVSYVHRRFLFLHLQLAMRRFYLGRKFGISTETLSYTQVRIHPKESLCPKITCLFSTDAEICSETPGLCLRRQYVMFVHGSRSELLLSRPNSKCDRNPPTVMFICSHVDYVQRAELINPVVFAYLDGEKDPCSTYTCNQCNTDTRIEVCEYGSHLALVFTTWVNLGPGLTPDDPRWRIYSCGYENRGVTLDPNDCTGSPRVSFENVSPLSLGELLSRNLSYLKDQRYRKVMRPVYRYYPNEGLWYLPTLPCDNIPECPCPEDLWSGADSWSLLLWLLLICYLIIIIKMTIEYALFVCAGLFLTVAWARVDMLPQPSPLYLAFRITLAITVAGVAFGFIIFQSPPPPHSSGPSASAASSKRGETTSGSSPHWTTYLYGMTAIAWGLHGAVMQQLAHRLNVSKWKAEKAEKKKKKEKPEQQLQDEVRDLRGQVTALTASVNALESANAELERRVTELQ
ncbi:hypothetical protein N7501_001505 [Penicillium viridicatum]|nr:hypothetical protein N7501_001505 [Penicillium viridicatum]